MDTFLQDLRYAGRKLLRTPGFTIIAISTLAIAIGATTSVFSIVDGVLLRPLPFASPERLVRITSTSRRDGKDFPISPPDYLDYRQQVTSFDGSAQFAQSTANFSTNDAEPTRLDRLTVGPTFFDVLGLQPVRGRFFASTEGRPESPNVAVISDKLWRTRFGNDPRTIGRTISLDERQYTIVGVAPKAASYPQPVDVWVPREIMPTTNAGDRGGHAFFAIGRLKRGVTIDRTRDEIAAVAARLSQLYPQFDQEFGATVQPLQEQMVGNLRPTLYSILGAVGFVLLIACANIANLLLVRASARSSEMAVRTALGAAKGRIVRQLVTESLLLAAIGALIGTAIAAWVVDAIVSFGPTVLPRLQDVSLNGHVLLFSAGIALFTGVVFGLVPAFYAARPDIATMLRSSSKSSRGGMNRVRSGLVVAEMALAVVLLVGAGLLIKSFVALMNVNPGFKTENVVTFDLSLPPTKYNSDRQKLATMTDVVNRLAALPGTQKVGMTVGRPFARQTMMTMFDVVGQPANDPMHRTITEVHAASPSYFDAMGMTLRSGRYFTPAEDRRDGHQVLLVNEEFARRYFPNQNAIGKSITLGMTYNEPAFVGDTTSIGGEIIGVVADVKQRGLKADLFPMILVPFNTLPGGYNSVVVRTSAAPSVVEAAIRAQIKQVDAHLPVIGLSTMSDVVASSVAVPRFYMTLLAAFASIALVLAAIGIYGVISFTVAQRARELGIRIALGATKERVVRLVLGEGLAFTLVGVAIGLVAALGLTRLISSMLFGVAAIDPVTFGVVGVVLVGVAALASWLPARRAASVDPLIAMRAE